MMNMKKTLIALALLVISAIVIAACSESTGAPAYVKPAMESTTTTTSELSTETASQETESETAAQTEAAAPFSASTTAGACDHHHAGHRRTNRANSRDTGDYTHFHANYAEHDHHHAQHDNDHDDHSRAQAADTAAEARLHRG